MKARSLVTVILGLPRIAKRAIALIVDAGLCVLTVWLAIYLRLGEFQTLDGPYLLATTLSVALALPIFIISGLYRAIFRYSGWPALMTVTKAMVAYGIVFAAVFLAIGVQGVPRTIGIIQPILLLLAIGGTRTVARYWLGGVYRAYFDKKSHTKALIYGAGIAGRQLAAALANSNEMRVVGFLDDDRSLQGQVLNGLAVFDPESLPDLAQSLDVEDVLLALPSVSRKRRNDILKKISTARVAIRTLPSVIDIAQGKVRTNDLRDLDIDDLLGREVVAPDAALLRKNINGQIVLITGAGGSIGSELCRQVLRLGPKTILLIDQSEYALYAIHQEISTQAAMHDYDQITIIPLLASVRDADRMREIFATWRPDTVYHAAAYKHVPMVEHNSAEGIRNNVFGTLVLAQAAYANQVKNFVLISTDKAVRPTNVMGASKRLAELVLQALSADDVLLSDSINTAYSKPLYKTVFSMVRFGNVLGSSGSVVPKFREQIRQGGPISLTHPEITRYFMTIPEAAQLVIQAGAMGIGGDVFVLDMGESIKIIDLAKRMVELSGLTIMDDQNPDGDIEIEIIGLRPGEKLFEELLLGDNPISTSHPRIMRAKEEAIPWTELKRRLEDLDASLSRGDFENARVQMQLLVKEYKPSSEVVDWLAN